MGGRSAPPQQTVTQNQLPEWYQQAGQRAIAQAEGIAAQPVNVYQGPRVAGFSQDQNDAIARVRQMQGQGAQAMAPVADVFRGVSGFQPRDVNTGFTPERVQAQDFLGANLQAYLNPQTEAIERFAMQNLARQGQQALNATQDAAIRAGAFGGSRLGVREAVAQAETARAAGELSANLRGQAFDRAASLIQADQARALQAAGMNQSAGLQAQQLRLTAEQANQAAAAQAAQIRLAGGSALGDAVRQERALTAQEIALLDAAGQQQQAMSQAQIDADMARFQEARDWELRGLNARLAALGQVNPGGTQTSTTTGGTRSNPIMGGIGGAAAGAALGSALLPGIGTAAGALLGGLGGIFSDDEAKTDVEKVSDTNMPGVSVYAFRYKSDPKSFGKTIGVMASEVERAMPEAVANVGGRRVIKPGFLGLLEAV